MKIHQELHPQKIKNPHIKHKRESAHKDLRRGVIGRGIPRSNLLFSIWI